MIFMNHFKRLQDFHIACGWNPPEHPLISMFRCDSNSTCAFSDEPFTADFYMIAFKKLKSGMVRYGRTKYDHASGYMMFMGPRQIMEIRDIELEEAGFIIMMHEDFINGHGLHDEIKNYHFFEYVVNEALNLSPKEEKIVWEHFTNLLAEYQNNPDEFSRELMLTNISSMLKYSQRFYKRQFIDRKELSGHTVSRFQDKMTKYIAEGKLETKGTPTVSYFASELNLSPRYLSDLLKQESGKTALELIHINLISAAKNMLAEKEQSVSTIAYALGFENLSYFSRLFKKETGLTPVQFKKAQLN